jgi:hypothetical protein
MISSGKFVKRVNADWTIDWICTDCFQTAASGKSDTEALARAEQHTCSGWLFALREERDRSNNSQQGTF